MPKFKCENKTNAKRGEERERERERRRRKEANWGWKMVPERSI